MVADPPLKLVLFENPNATSALNHLGVELASAADVVAASDRFASIGLPHTTPEVDACCHAVQDKVWVDAPDVPLGAWEFYVVLGDDPSAGVASTGACCIPATTDDSRCCVGSGRRLEMTGSAAGAGTEVHASPRRPSWQAGSAPRSS